MDWMNDYLKGLKEYARDYVLENTSLKVLALLITGVLWLSVASRPVSQVALNGAIEFNLPESPALTVSKYDTATARVYLEGPREALDTLRAGQLTVTADMTAVEPGVRVIPLKVEPGRNGLPLNVRVEKIEPPRISVTVERTIEREVTITPRWEGEPPPGSEVIDWQITPPTVKIGGAESQMREITGVSTETVRLTDKTGTFSEHIAIDIGSPNLTLSEDSPRKVMLVVNVDEVRKERVIDDVPVALFGAPARARAIPRFVKVTLYGARSILASMTVADVSVGVEYQGGTAMFTPRVTLSPDLADRVVVRSVEPKTVRVR
ncbi:MAG TPA: CdaR family protein [Blastocatellia bacterium]|nr:CdaR family protein [Blastocatellia bacterium]